MRWGAILALVILTRWLPAPQYLFYLDNINFALAIDEFNPAKHQPQPPGDPLFVAAEKLLHIFIPSVKSVQLAAGAIGSLIAIAALWKLGDVLFGRPAGLIAVGLLLFHPVFWLAGIGNHVRTFLTAGPIVMALCVWCAWSAKKPARWFVFASLAYGIAGGFRPELLLLLFPLWLSVPIRRRFRAAELTCGIVALACAILPWAIVLVSKSGGLAATAQSFIPYFFMHTSKASSLLGAPPSRAAVMGILAIYWTGIGVLSWIWAVPFVTKEAGSRLEALRPQIALLATWFLPGFLFHVLIHSDDPDHMLDIIPVTCLVGSLVLLLFSQRFCPRLVWLVAGIAALLNAVLFFVPPHRFGKEATYQFVRMTGESLAGPVNEIKKLPNDGATVIIMNRTYVTARQIGYYFPADSVLTTDTDLTAGCPAGSMSAIVHNQLQLVASNGDAVQLPRAMHVALLLGGDAGPVPESIFVRHGPVLVADAPLGEFAIGKCRFFPAQ